MVKDDEPTELPPLYIRERMKTLRVTGVEVADRMKTTPATVSRLINGKRKMTLEWLFAFSKALDVPIESLLASPSEKTDQSITSEPEILAMLKRIDGLGERGVELAMMTIDTARAASSPKPGSPSSDDPPAPATPHHGSLPSRK